MSSTASAPFSPAEKRLSRHPTASPRLSAIRRRPHRSGKHSLTIEVQIWRARGNGSLAMAVSGIAAGPQAQQVAQSSAAAQARPLSDAVDQRCRCAKFEHGIQQPLDRPRRRQSGHIRLSRRPVIWCAWKTATHALPGSRSVRRSRRHPGADAAQASVGAERGFASRRARHRSRLAARRLWAACRLHRLRRRVCRHQFRDWQFRDRNGDLQPTHRHRMERPGDLPAGPFR